MSGLPCMNLPAKPGILLDGDGDDEAMSLWLWGFYFGFSLTFLLLSSFYIDSG